MALKQPLIAPFPRYAPDKSNLLTGVASVVQNVFPRYDGYGPVPSLVDYTQSLPGPCRGLFFARRSDGSIAIFGATATDLYRLNNTDFSWTLVSKGSVSYTTVAIDRNWEFGQFNDTVLAAQQNTVIQSFALASSTNFGDLTGAPQAGNVSIVGFFVVATEILGNAKRVQWSDLGNITVWTAGVGLSDFQDMSDGGNCHVVAGGDAFGVLFQDSAIRTLTYAPGSPTVFQILRIGTNESLFGRYSVITVGSVTYYHGANGFKRILNGAPPEPIGKGIVDDTVADQFRGDWDSSNVRLMMASNDPNNTRIYWGYKSKAGSAGLLDKILVYDPAISQTGQFSLIVGQTLEYLTSLAKPGLTLENMDAFGAGVINVTNAANNGAGKVRLTLSPGTTNGPFTIIGQNTIEVQGVLGTTEANGTWQAAGGGYTIIDTTHIDLNVTFTNAYVSGGAIGGSLETIGFSFDTISSSAVAQLAGVNSNHKAGFFTGANLEAIVETEEQDDGGNLIFVDAARPFTDCPGALVSYGMRANAQQTTPVYTIESAVDNTGQSNLMAEARYMRARLRCPAGSSWIYARAIQVFAQEAGEQ